MDFLTIGNITKDLIPGGYTVGGTVTYASVAAMRLGRQAGVLTRMGPDLTLPDVYRDVELHALPSTHTLTFENVYTPDGRVQTIHALADAIGVQDVPEAVLRHPPPIVLLGPLAGELDPRVADLFPDALRGVVPQGWMRRLDQHGRVSHVPITCTDDVLRYADVLVVSTEDVNHDISLAGCYAEMVRIVVLTRGIHGADVYHSGHVTHVRPRPAQQIDPTGAGDTFTAAFLIYYSETGDPIKAARFANVAASFSVEGLSYSATPTRAQVEAYLAEHGW
ncbi:MAG TPA: PfkB family carbohydrate kinase [Anaerolineae bacterium]|nr:PfkB family carbohydrate kinase [Anaerolineae bacterium]